MLRQASGGVLQGKQYEEQSLMSGSCMQQQVISQHVKVCCTPTAQHACMAVRDCDWAAVQVIGEGAEDSDLETPHVLSQPCMWFGFWM